MPLFLKREDKADEVNISGMQVLAISLLGLSSSMSLVWLIVRYWIFAR